VLENTRREFGGVGWPGCGMVDIILVGRRSAAAHRKKKSGGLMQESLKSNIVISGEAPIILL